MYVELKTKTGRLSKVQRWQIAEMRKRKVDVRVLYGLDDVLSFLEEVFPVGVSTP